MKQLCHCATSTALTIELLKEEGKENYTVIGYLNIKQKNGDVLVRVLERFPYIINKEHALHVYAELKKDWNMNEDIGGRV